ncbi:HEPN domain-containing protein [Streptosporangium sp. NPDC004379]|uniref:HEPN domain-containing protein n=1 Tax=Streptosporangium sp. NPDC004379 TaxID=3366189 RepID=UPI00367E5D34
MEHLLAQRRLQKIGGSAADGTEWLERARRTLRTAQAITADPDSAFILAYDAARHACTALLAHQGLRPTTAGGHYVVEEVLRAQFGDAFRSFGALRRRRNEIEYPMRPGDDVEQGEAAAAITAAGLLIDAAGELMPSLSLF